ncbi:unnamed protein product [Mortierella alpina]
MDTPHPLEPSSGLIVAADSVADTVVSPTMTTPLAVMPHELLVKIFYNLEQRPRHRHTPVSSVSFSSSLTLDRTDILSCALVSQDWYFAAVDALWRDIDLQSIESFIQFSRALDPHSMSLDSRSLQDEEGDRQCGPEQEQSRHVSEKGKTTKASACGSSRASSLVPFLVPENNPSRSLSEKSPSCSMSSLQCSPSIDRVGHAGKGFIRTFSMAGTTDCQSPRPFPNLPSCITDQHLMAISTQLCHLTSLSLSHCSALTDMAVITAITASSPYLKTIDLRGCRRITNLVVQVIAQLCSQLEDISLRGCALVTDDALEELAIHCTRLQTVDISQCHRASDKALLALLESSGRMKQLDPSSKARTRNARLTTLSVAGCRGVSLAGLVKAMDQLSHTNTTEQNERGSEQCSLVSLEFSCPGGQGMGSAGPLSGAVDSPSSATGQTHARSAVSQFFQGLPATLEKLTIHDAHILNHDDIISLVRRVGTSLKSLRLDNANAVNSETLTYILTLCPNLTVLCIPRAIRLDDAGVIQLTSARCAQSLVELDLSSCHSLTDRCLIGLAEASKRSGQFSEENVKGKSVEDRQEQPSVFPNLRKLDLSYNDKLTLTGIIPLVLSLKSLCALDVSFCGDGVTRSWTNPSLPALVRQARQEETHNRDTTSSADMENTEETSPGSRMIPCQQDGQQLNLQNLQRSSPTNNPSPTSPTLSQLGLRCYVGPQLNTRSASSAVLSIQDNSIIPLHPQQYPGQGSEPHQHHQSILQSSRRRSSASSVSSSSSSSSSSTTSSSVSATSSSSSSTSSLDSKEHQHPFHSSGVLVPLIARMDVIEALPTRIGMPAYFHQDAWFTPQHQQQLQQLFQIQLQQQQDLQNQQMQAALTGAGQQHQLAAATALAHATAMAPLLPEMMAHSIMAASRVGAASVDGDGGMRQLGNGQVDVANVDIFGLNANFGTLRLNPRGDRLNADPGPHDVGHAIPRHYFRRQYQTLSYGRRGHLVGVMAGHCEISAWGLTKLKEEWAFH